MRRILAILVLLVALQVLHPLSQASAESKFSDVLGVSTSVNVQTGAITVSKWAGEASLAMTLKAQASGGVATSQKVTLQYPGLREEVTKLADGVEIDLILEFRPLMNIWSWDISLKGLTFYYQPPLDQDQGDPSWASVNATHALGSKGELLAYRPLDVVGSYAVYGSKSGNDYGTGKVIHIYRPRVTDSKGSETWGALKAEAGILSVTVDRKWLDEASYPVRVDPILGYDQIGGSTYTISSDKIFGWLYTIPKDGIGRSISAYLYSASSPGNCKFGLYKHSDLSFIKGTSESQYNTTPRWITLSFTGGDPYLTAGTDYLPVFWPDFTTGNNVYVKYDSSGSSLGHYKAQAYNNWPNPLVSPSHFTFKYSLYLIYDERWRYISASAGQYGSISPSGLVQVEYGMNKQFSMIPDSGEVVDVVVDSSSVGPVSSYTFTNVVANHTLSASFSPIYYGGIYSSALLLSAGSFVIVAAIVLLITRGEVENINVLAFVLIMWIVLVLLFVRIIAALENVTI